MDDNKEMQLEQVAERAIRNAQQLNLAPPIFELFAALLALSFSILMFLFPDILDGKGGFYSLMTTLMGQTKWALSFFVAGITGSIGMLANKTWIRVAGLMLLSLIFGILTVFYATLLPNFGFLLMLWITIFTVASIPLVKYTGIWNKK